MFALKYVRSKVKSGPTRLTLAGRLCFSASRRCSTFFVDKKLCYHPSLLRTNVRAPVQSKQMVRILLILLVQAHLSLSLNQNCQKWCQNLVSQTHPVPLERVCTSFCAIESAAANTRRISRSTRGNLFGRPLRRPKDYQKRHACRKCEAKRSSCFNYYLWTYGICGIAYAVGGNIASTGCNVITLPRTVGKYYCNKFSIVFRSVIMKILIFEDCTLNTLLNCYMRRCGLIGI